MKFLTLLLFILLSFSAFAQEADEYYILPDFIVTDDGDKGYYSANSLAGTKTNELTKNIPITISTVNQEMIKDFEMSSLSDLGQFVPSIESEGNVYNNQEIRFRGFLTRSQLFEFMPRYSPLNYYNIQRADVVRGANSLIYGQSDPGGKVNLISKTSNASKDSLKITNSLSRNDSKKVIIDGNKVLTDALSVRLLGVNQKSNYDQNFRFYEFDGLTLEGLYKVNNNTRIRLHLEEGEVERSVIGGTFKVGSGSSGLPLGIVADPKLADLLEEPFYQYIVNYNDGSLRTNSPGLLRSRSTSLSVTGPLITDYITSRSDISDMFSEINYKNTGTGNGSDSYLKQEFDYNFVELMHTFSDQFEIKASIGIENLDGEILNGGYSANHIRHSFKHGKGQNIPNVPGNTTYDDLYSIYSGNSADGDSNDNTTLIGEALNFDANGFDPLVGASGININVDTLRAYISNTDRDSIETTIENSIPSQGWLFRNMKEPNTAEFDGDGSISSSEMSAMRAIMSDLFYDALDAGNTDISNSDFWVNTRAVKDLIKYVINDNNIGNNAIWDRFILPALIAASGAETSDETNSLGEINPSLSSFANDVNDMILIRKWKKQSKSDDNISFRGTANYSPDRKILNGKQSFLFGIDLDKRDASVTSYEEYLGTSQTYPNGVTLNADQSDQYILLQQLLGDTEGNGYSLLNNKDTVGHDLIDANFGQVSRGVANTLASNYSISLDPNLERVNRISDRFTTTVKTSGLWLANSGSYYNGKLRTLFGCRYDRIDVAGDFTDYKRNSIAYDNDINSPTYGEVQSMLPKTGNPDDTSLIENHISPSLGALYWFNENISVFANFSESIISPTGFQYDVMGKLTPPESGMGREFGFKFSNQDNTINAQLAFFRIDKKNDQRSNLSWPQLQSIFPFKNDANELYSYSETIYSGYSEIINDDGTIDYTGEVFDPIGTRIANEETRSEGIELDFYYNPSRSLSLFLGYAFLDTTYLDSIIPSLEGLTVPGTSNHNLNAQIKYTFRKGKYKGVSCGLNYKYRSAALLNNYFTDINDDRESDYFPKEDPNGGGLINPSHFEFKLEDQYSTDAFIGWSGKLSKQKGAPAIRLQLNINNLFDDIHLISTGSNNARYTASRNVTLSSTISF
jgi:outer membrane receptor protein involved in Fe transport